MDYTSDESQAVETSNDNEEKVFVEDNTIIEGQSDKIEDLVEISVRTRKPVLTQQVIMELVESQASSIRTPSNVGWERKKEEYNQMLEGWESPTSRTVQVDVGLATLMIISAMAENTNKINLAAQHEQREMMIKQAELHRETLEKEFTNGLERVRAESEKAISEQKKLREEYARSCPLDNGDKTLQGVVDNQGMAMVSLQMGVLQKLKERAQQELKEARDNHEREMRHQKELIRAQEKIIEEERQKNNQLKEELGMFEENVLQGIMSSESKIMPKSRTESPASPKHKRIKIGDEKPKDNNKLEINSSEDKIGIKQEAPQGDEKELKLVPIYFDANDKVHYDVYNKHAR